MSREELHRGQAGTCCRWRQAGILAFLCLAVSTCTTDRLSADENAVSDKSSTVAGIEFFEKRVRPVLVRHCYECHSRDEVNGGLSLESSETLLRGGDSGAAIVPGDPDASLLIKAVRYGDRDLQMPPQNRLAAKEIDALQRWVAIGAPDPRRSEDVARTTGGMSIEEGREFWSFRGVADPPIPNVEDQQWVRTPIDAFVLSRLSRKGLHPAPQSDRATLARRVYLDLIGLPPTPEEIDAFVADESPRAFERLIDRLLAMPEYGQRWGRHWLDVARYADSNGLDENLAFGNAWRFRDYVVDAFNNDKPFDRFLVEQIAGDLLSDATRETRIATGFLVLGAKVLAEPDREKLAMDTIDEQLDATGKAFLGMTLGCVRCHDHKFDPIKQTDYYSLAAIFKSTKTFGDTKTGAILHWNEHSLATDDEVERIKKVDAQIAAKKNAATSYKNKALEAIRAQARAMATEYLVAATKFAPDDALTEIERIAMPLGLHPRVLHHCRLHLQYHANDPFFAKWHEANRGELSSQESAAQIDAHYRPLFKNAEAALMNARKRNPQVKTLEDKRLEEARAVLYNKSGLLAVPIKPRFALDAASLAEYDRLMEEARVIESVAPDLPSAMGVEDSTIQDRLPIHIRGSHRNLGRSVEREFPAVMRTSTVRPIFPSNQSGRLELARWMASTQHPLTARVYVNRVWRWHFGVGLVKSTENFGALGDPPSHPELLDWLARRFMQSGWSTKHLHRVILSSRVYQMASNHPGGNRAASIDPENRLLWKFPLRRMEAEQIRDAILVSTERLDRSMGGKTVPLRNRQFVFNHTSVDHTKYDSLRRALYLPVIRNNLYSLLEQFDFPDPTMPTGDRTSTIVAPQALWLMNSDLVIDSAEALAFELLEESASDASRVELAYRKILGRRPSHHETSRGLAFVDESVSGWRINSADADAHAVQMAWMTFIQSLLASNEFIYVR